MDRKDITTELWREYDFGGRTYRIIEPVALWVGTTTHRVLDPTGVVHCLPNVGHNGCVLRWQNKDPMKPVTF